MDTPIRWRISIAGWISESTTEPVTQAQWIRRVVKPLLWAAGLTPLGWLLYAAIHDNLTADPVKAITHFTGRTILVILFLTLSITPLRRLTGFSWLARVRRLVGLFAFFYAVLHLVIYLAFDRGFVFTELGEDILKRPYITVGFTAWLILLTLAVTSPIAMVKRLGGKRWQALHRLVYVAPVLGVIHFAWAQKKDIRLPLIYAAILGGIFVWRLGSIRRKRAPG